MFARSSVAVKLVALTLLALPGAALAQQQQDAARPSTDTRAAYRTNPTLSKVIIYGSLGAIAGALGSLRVRRGADTLGADEDTSVR